MKLSRVGVDLAKNVFQLHGVDRRGKGVRKRQLSYFTAVQERSTVKYRYKPKAQYVELRIDPSLTYT